jgi:redox-sensitive bicupin YhaK (pirin superfamily)
MLAITLKRPPQRQWMTAGKGIVHSEFPEQEESLASSCG